MFGWKRKLAQAQSDVTAAEKRATFAWTEAAENRQTRDAERAKLVALAEELETAIQSPSYLLPKDSSESWADYRRRIRDVLWEGRESEFFRAVQDELGRQERVAFADWLTQLDPAKAEQMRLAAAAAHEIRVSLVELVQRCAPAPRRAAMADYSLLDLDNQMLASGRREV